jgi:predicted RNA binding protein YcfA (HicA-like mRNA interferase family)
MDSKNIIKRLKKDGWFEVNQVGGQKQFRHPTKPGRVTVPRPLDAVMDDPHNRDAVAFLVAAPIQDRTVRVNVAFRQSALDRIDA